MTDPGTRDTTPLGVLYALGAYGLWGIAPAYWKLLGSLPPAPLLAHRVLWSLGTGLLLVLATRRAGELRGVLRSPRHALPMLLSATLIGTNWFVFLWAVANNRVLDTSLGYYINPLINVLFGTIFLRERLRTAQIVAVGLAAAGVVQLVIVQGSLPWISLVLAVSFALYGLVRKLAPVMPVVGFTVEALVLAPVGSVYLWFGPWGDGGMAAAPLGLQLLIVCSGPFTAAPLLLFNGAAKRLRLSTIGLIQYIAPSMAFVLAVVAYGEPFTRAQAFTFGCVWLALAIYSIDSVRAQRGG
ncbi:MAG: EamA family transporter RarD [Myxococcota bacterium]